MASISLSRPDNNRLGVALITGSVLLMSLADGLVKFLSSEATLWQIYVIRSLVALPLLAALLVWRGRRLRPRALGWAALRSALLVLLWIAYYAALPVLSLSAAAVALYTAPLFIALFATLLIGEPAGPRRWLAIGLGFAGVLVVLRPGTADFSWFLPLPVLGAASYALAMILTRSKCQDEDPLALAFALNLALMIAGLLASLCLFLLDLSPGQVASYPFLLANWVSLDPRAIAILAVLGLLIALYSAGVAKAYQVATPTAVATFDYSYLVFATLWGFLLFAEVPDAPVLLGMAMIAGAGALVMRD